MQRGDAIQVLRDFIRVCADNSVAVSSVSLIAPSHDNGFMGYQLKIGVTLDSACRDSLMPLLKEKGIEMEENDGFVFIFKR